MTTPTGTIDDIGQFYDANNVEVGSAAGFHSPVGTADPPDTDVVFDATTWAAPWVPFGGTDQGWQVNWNPSTQDINIDEQPTPVDEQMTTATLQLVASLAESSISNFQLAYNADTTVTAPGVSQVGKTRLTPARVLKRVKAALETQAVNDFPMRYVIDEATVAANVSSAFQRAGKRMIPITCTSVCPMSGIKIDIVTASATG